MAGWRLVGGWLVVDDVFNGNSSLKGLGNILENERLGEISLQ